MRLTIIANDLNDHEDLKQTLLSILATAPGREIEMIVVDDFSKVPLTLGEEYWEQHATENQTLTILRPPFRMGCGGSRHHGAVHSTGDFILFIDSHMRFTKGWYEAAEARIVGRPQTIHCACCVGLCEGNMDPEQTSGGLYTGATLNIFGPDKNAPGKVQVMEGVWKDHISEEAMRENPPRKVPLQDVEIPCIMGACYFVPREWFFKIGGMPWLRQWGADEPLLAIKTWFAGGECRLLDTVRIGHKFKDRQPYAVDFTAVLYNKVRMIMTCLGDKEAIFLTARLGATSQQTPGALAEIARDRKAINAERDWNRNLFVRDLKWLSAKFAIPYPDLST